MYYTSENIGTLQKLDKSGSPWKGSRPISNKFSGTSKACNKVKPNLLVCKMSQHLDKLFFSTTSKVKTYHAINVGRKSQQKKGATAKRINTFCWRLSCTLETLHFPTIAIFKSLQLQSYHPKLTHSAKKRIHNLSNGNPSTNFSNKFLSYQNHIHLNLPLAVFFPSGLSPNI